MTAVVHSTEGHLQELTAGLADGYGFVLSINDANGFHRFGNTLVTAGNIGKAAQATSNAALLGDMYVSCTATTDAAFATLADGKRGGKAQAKALVAVWADIDISGPGHKTEKAYPTSMEDVDAILAELPEVSMLVHSGGGVHAWWLLAQPYVFDDDAERRTRATALSEGWAATVVQVAQRQGFSLDQGVGGLDRVLRVCGTYNWKNGGQQPVDIVGCGEWPATMRYTVEQLEEHIRESPAGDSGSEPARSIPRGEPQWETVNTPLPGDRYEELTTWDELLTGDGWTFHHVDNQTGCKHWTRPGKAKKDGSSATTGNTANDNLHVFTSSHPTLKCEGNYDRFGYLAVTRFGGDHSAAARWISQAYPDPTRTTPPAGVDPETGLELLASDHRSVDLWKLGAHRTDAGNAVRFVALFGHKIRWCPDRGRWLIWTGHQWQWDDAGEVVHAAKLTAIQMGRQAFNLPNTTAEEDKVRKASVAWALTSENLTRLRAMIELARSEPGIAVAIDELDADPFLLNCTNGVINLRTGELLAHNPKRLITKMAGATFRPDAEAQTWMTFLERILPDGDVREFVHLLAGYCATGDVGEQKLFIAYGGGANGKTVLLETLRRVLGDYGDQAEPDLLLARRDAHPTGLAKLAGKRLVLVAESDDGRRLAEATVKRLTGGDLVTARFMNRDFFEFPPSHKLIMATNHKPQVRGTDHGIWRRIRLIPFVITIPDAEQDPRLLDKLHDERDGILRWVIDGAVGWCASGLTEPSAVTEATAEYRADNDTIGAFLAECCDLTDPAVMTPAADLYVSYKGWCSQTGEDDKSQKLFGAALTERGLDRMKAGSKRRSHWIGIRISSGPPQGEPMNPSEPEEPTISTRARIKELPGITGPDGFMGSPPSPTAESAAQTPIDGAPSSPPSQPSLDGAEATTDDLCAVCHAAAAGSFSNGLCPACSSAVSRPTA